MIDEISVATTDYDSCRAGALGAAGGRTRMMMIMMIWCEGEWKNKKKKGEGKERHEPARKTQKKKKKNKGYKIKVNKIIYLSAESQIYHKPRKIKMWTH